MSKKFNRSEFMKERHKVAKEQRDFFKDEFGEAPSYSQFLKKESPLLNYITTYEVSYQLSYRGETDHLNISPRTFKVVAFKGDEADIYNRTMSMILDGKGKLTDHHLHPNTLEMIENNINISVYPRGMEESQKKPTSDEVHKVISSRFEISELDKEIKFTNKKKRTGELVLDIRHFQ